MANKYFTEGTPFQIAYFNNRKLIIDINRFNDILEKVGNHPLSVISVNGPMRSGKSYILGHFLRYLSVYTNSKDWLTTTLKNEFRWLNSAERQTTGIHMWSQPFFIKRGGQEVAVLLMDTQGCFDDKSTNTENSLIFALSCLLSSVLIYNVSKQLSEEILQFLQMFVGYAKMTDGEDSEQSQSFSKLVFLIRDWQFPRDFEFGYHDEAGSPGQRNFKKEKLNAKHGMVPEVRIAREEIISSFKNIGCCLMPYPGDDLALYDNVEKLNPRFIQILKGFVPSFFDAQNIVTKKICEVEINGVDFKRYVERWAEYFSKCEIPEVKSINESTAEVQNQIALSIGLKFYRGEMDTVINNSDGLPDEELTKIHKKNKEEAVKIFRRMKRLKHVELERRYSKYLEDGIEQALTSYQKINLTNRKFKDFKAESEEEKKRFKKKMKKEMKKIEEERKSLNKEMEENRALRKTTSGDDSGTGIGQLIGGIVGLTLVPSYILGGTLLGTARTIATGDSGEFKKSFDEMGEECTEIMKKFGWKEK